MEHVLLHHLNIHISLVHMDVRPSERGSERRVSIQV